MAFLKTQKSMTLGVSLATLMLSFMAPPIAHSEDEGLRSLSYVEFVEKYKDSDKEKLRDVLKAIVQERQDLKNGKAKDDIDAKAAELKKTENTIGVYALLTKNLDTAFGSETSNQKRESVNKLIKEGADKVVSDALQKEALVKLGKDSIYDVKVARVPGIEDDEKKGNVRLAFSLHLNKDALAASLKRAGIKETSLSTEEAEKLTETFASELLPSSEVLIDATSKNIPKEVEEKLAKHKPLNWKDKDSQSNLAKKIEDARIELSEVKSSYEAAKSSGYSASSNAKLGNMAKLADKIRTSKERPSDECEFIKTVIDKSALDKDDFAHCYANEAAARDNKRNAAHAGKDDADEVGGHGELDPYKKDEKTADAEKAAKDAADAANANAAAQPQLSPLEMQLAMQREANINACLNANQQMMAAAPQMALDDKFNKLLAGFESTITGSTLIPQVLVGIPEDLTGPGAYLQAQNAVEDLVKDWSLNDTETHDKVRKELRAAEAAVSKAAGDFEAYRFRLSRIGMLNDSFDSFGDSPEMIKLAKLERNMAAAGAVKETLQKMHTTIRSLTRSTLNSIGSSRTSRDSQVPSVGVPRVAPSR